jgi:CO dehydrogenase/acetyl-CoA synthase epsilon subunit
MAVKMLTTKKHTKTTNVINTIKETNKPIQVVKLIKKPKIILKRPMLKVGQTITMQDYINAHLIVKQYEKENPIVRTSNQIYINLFDMLDTRTINGVMFYFKNKGLILLPNKIEKSKLNQIDLYEIGLQPNFGKKCMLKLTELLDKIK